MREVPGGRDGRTVYERRRGRKRRIPVVAFGEKVWHKELRAGKERKNKFESEWEEGVWMGHCRESNEAIMGTKAGVIRACAIKRQPVDNKWDNDLVKRVRGTPQQLDPNRPGLSLPIKVNFDPPVEGEREVLEQGQETKGR